MGEMNYGVVIVNWNGAADTIACLKSIVMGGNCCRVIVIDNGSTDDSMTSIADEMRLQGLRCRTLATDEQLESTESARILLIPTGENLGFAAGCNRGLRIAAAIGCNEVVFLKNDTLVEGDALNKIVQRLQLEPTCFACLPMLTIFGSDRIWNCGGSASRLGLRHYYLAGRDRAEGARHGEIRCSFFTGCCFAVRTEDFVARNGFSERFFFGEEDFEIALWMKDCGLTAVCLTVAVVQHKVSVSFSAAAGNHEHAKVFLYYLNRFIHMRLRFGTLGWWVWALIYLPYVICLLWLGGTFGLAELLSFVRRLLLRARTMDGVTRADFEAVMEGRI